MNYCPINGCDRLVQNERLMCWFHWKLVPQPLKDTIWLLHNNGIKRQGHAEACLNAVRQVNEKMERQS